MTTMLAALYAKQQLSLFFYPFIFLADRTACSMTGYWHDNISVCLPVRPSVCDAVHCS